jgi:hypothetical protein
MNQLTLRMFLLLALSLTGCAGTYRHDASLPAAQLRTAPFVTSKLCLGDGAQSLVPGADGFATIPAGRPLHIAAALREKRGYCFPGVSFTPEAGKRYEYVIDARDEHCVGTMVVEDSTTLIGITKVMRAAVAPGSCTE